MYDRYSDVRGALHHHHEPAGLRRPVYDDDIDFMRRAVQYEDHDRDLMRRLVYLDDAADYL